MAEDEGEPPGSPPAGQPLLDRRLLTRAALESALIVLSVFLALFLDEWRSERELEERTTTARAYIVREVKTNREALQADPVLPYHLRTQRMLTDALGPPGPARARAEARLDSGAFTGVHPFRASNVAWTSFRSAELTSRLPPDELFALAQIYDAQEDLERLSELLIQGMMQPSSDEDSKAYDRSRLNNIRMYYNDVLPAERSLLIAYQRVLSQLEQRPRR